MAPLMIGLASVSEPAVKLILTDKWLPSVFYLRIFCISFMFYPIHTANLNAIKAMGRSDLFLKLEIAKKNNRANCFVRNNEDQC
jgi:O-antigen/teichoic acid export membrane protein